jgi:hypothetical protein
MKYWLITGTIAAAVTALTPGVHAQSQLPVPPADARGIKDVTPIESASNPAIEYLVVRHGITRQEAALRLEVQGLVASQLGGDNPQAPYDDVWIEHEPQFKVIVTFIANADRTSFIKSLDPKLQRYVMTRVVSRKRTENQQALESLGKVLSGAGLRFDSGYYPQTQKLIVTVANNDDAQKARQLVPQDLQGLVQVRVGPLVTNQQTTAPVGAMPGDYAQGGMTIHHSFPDREEGQPWCTAGFAVTYGSGKQGIVTAGHCGPPLHLYINDHYIALGNPIVPLSTSWTGIYDYAIYDIGSAVGRNIVEFKDYNSIPEFPDRGTFRVTNWITGASQRVGYATCKSGFTTGITCGKILSTFVGSGGNYGFVEVGDSTQERLSKPGDSGGPWFYQATSVDVYAMGIHSRGIGATQTCSTTTCRAYYMPIDRIWAHNTTVRPRTSP